MRGLQPRPIFRIEFQRVAGKIVGVIETAFGDFCIVSIALYEFRQVFGRAAHVEQDQAKFGVLSCQRRQHCFLAN